jgi:hypothetical protein
MLTPYKFIIQAVMLDLDENGDVRGEAVAQPEQVFGVDALHDYADAFPAKLSQANAERNGLVLPS